jgi:uncharacterized protein (TIGR02145 family)
MKHQKLLVFVITLFCLGLFRVQAQTVTDIDGNVYNTVTIGTQTWMKENLRTTKFNDSSSILTADKKTVWKSIGDNRTPAYLDLAMFLKRDSMFYNKKYQGLVYNWYAVNTGRLCPTNWHVPSKSEYITLVNYLGGFGIASNKMRDTCYIYGRDKFTGRILFNVIDSSHILLGMRPWALKNGATNESGFSALSGLVITDTGAREAKSGIFVRFWTTTEDTTLISHKSGIYAILFAIFISEDYSFYSNTGMGGMKMNNALHVRCLKDE